MPLPDYQALMLPLLRLATTGEKRVPDVEQQLAETFGLTPDERAQLLPSGKQRILHNRAHWAKFYLMKAGLLEFPARGRFRITDAGRELLARNPERVNVQALLAYPAFAEFYNKEAAPQPQEVPAAVPSVTPEEQIEAAYASLTSALRSDLLARVLQNTPAFFERVIVELLVAMGYGGSHKNASQQLGQRGDGGVDGVINEDPLGLDRVYVQAKRYAPGDKIGRPDVQAFLGSLVGLGATKGVFVTTSTFSTQARDFCRYVPQRVILIDGDMLADLMIEHNVGVRVSKTVEFKRVDEDFFSEDDDLA